MNPLIMLGEAATVSTISTAMSTALGTVASDGLSAIASIAPVAVPVLGAMLVVGIAIKSFKKISGQKGS